MGSHFGEPKPGIPPRFSARFPNAAQGLTRVAPGPPRAPTLGSDWRFLGAPLGSLWQPFGSPWRPLDIPWPWLLVDRYATEEKIHLATKGLDGFPTAGVMFESS